MNSATASDPRGIDAAAFLRTDALRAALPTHLKNKHDNGTLARFLFARGGNVAKAAEMVVACDSWRSSRALDQSPVPPTVAVSIPVRGYRSIVDSNLPAEDSGLLPEYCYRLNKYWAGGGYHGVDRDGQPIFIERLGYHDAKGLAKNVKLDEFLEWHIRNMEFFQRVLLKECEERSLRRASARRKLPSGTVGFVESCQVAVLTEEDVPLMKPKMTAIFDCTGMGFHQFYIPALKFAQAVSDLDQKYYPETLNTLFIVNAPRMFVSMWNMIKKWLDQNVIDKIKIFGGQNDYQPVLIKYIPEHVLPTFLGGSCTCSHMPGGCVPSGVLGNIKPAQHDPSFPFSVSLFPRSGTPAQATDPVPSASHAYQLVVNRPTTIEKKVSATAAVVRFRTDVFEVGFEVRKSRTAPAALSNDGGHNDWNEGTHDDLIILPRKIYAANLYPVTVRFQCMEACEYILVWDLPADVALPEPSLEYAVFVEREGSQE